MFNRRIGLVAVGVCMAACSDSNPKQVSSAEWNLTSALYAVGTQVPATARFFFNVANSSDCHVATTDFSISYTGQNYAPPADLGCAVSGVYKVSLAAPDAGACVYDVRALCNPTGAGHTTMTMKYLNDEYKVATDVEARDADHVAVNLVGFPKIQMTPGVYAKLEATLEDVNNVPLLGGTFTLSGADANVLEVTPDTVSVGWWVKGLAANQTNLVISASNGLSTPVTANIVAPSDLVNVSFFTTTMLNTVVSQPDSDVVLFDTPVVPSNTFPTMQWTPIGSTGITVIKGDEINIIAAPVDVFGTPTFTGTNTVTYTMANFTATIAQPVTTTASFTDGAGIAQSIGSSYLAVQGETTGNSTVSATWNGKTGSTIVYVQ